MEREADHWQVRLPADLLDHVAWPVRMKTYCDDGLPATKWHGYDALGLLCYYRHVYSRWTADFDDTTTPIELQAREELEAWRTLLGTWVRRVQRVRRAEEGQAPDAWVVDSGFELVTARSIPRL